MTNKEHNELAFLLQTGFVVAEIDSSGGGIFGLNWIEYAVYIPKLQRELCGDLDEFDGIHYIDRGEYCGYADTLEEAYREFMSNNPNLDSYVSNYDGSTHDIDAYVDHVLEQMQKGEA